MYSKVRETLFALTDFLMSNAVFLIDLIILLAILILSYQEIHSYTMTVICTSCAATAFFTAHIAGHIGE